MRSDPGRPYRSCSRMRSLADRSSTLSSPTRCANSRSGYARRCRLTPTTSVSTAPPSRQKKTIPTVWCSRSYAVSSDRQYRSSPPSTCMRTCRTGWSTQSTRSCRTAAIRTPIWPNEAPWIAIELLNGMRTCVAHVRMPVCAPPTQLLTAPGTGPYAEMIRRAEALDDPRIVNISIAGGFAFADTPKNGLTVLVTTRGDALLASRVAHELASYGWQERAAFTPRLTPLNDAVNLAKATGDDASRVPVLLADVA